MTETLAAGNGSRGSNLDRPSDGDRPAGSDDSFAQLRSIIVGPERRELRALQAHVLDPTVQTRDVSRVLPDALQLRANDPQLMRALAPSIEEAITASVRKDPQPLADALFPVIGPAIRKAVAHTLAAMMESINLSIERSVSWQAVQWRWTAWRTGKPFAEVVLLNTLEYRIEQVFLIHRESGLLLQHVAVEKGASEDADQISGMLTAIRDFARDSFNVGASESLESMRVGDLAVHIEQGPHAILAAVVRGTITSSVRAALQDALERVHRQFGPALQTFDGDAAPFDAVRPVLEACLVSQQRAASRRPSYRRWAVAAAILLVALAAWTYFDVRDRQRWNAYVDRLSAEPGIVVLSSGRRAGKFFVAGLRDPLASDPVRLVTDTRLAPEAIESRWEPYQALHPPFVTARAALLLRPPAGVTLTFNEGLLTASGSAPEQWIADTQRLAPAIAGVNRFTFAGESAEHRLTAQIEAVTLGFAKGESSVAPGQHQTLDSLIAWLEELNDILASSGRRATIEVVGHADSDGPDDLNSELSQERANYMIAMLRGASVERLDFSARGLGRAPLVPGATEAEHERNRRVSFRVHMQDAAALRSGRP